MKGLLENAVESGEILEMIYLSDKGEISQRRIKVIEVSPGIISGYCMLRKKPRFFKRSNILSIGTVRKKHVLGA
jgi:predicted DNA-binding transcriptional regulator YafY